MSARTCAEVDTEDHLFVCPSLPTLGMPLSASTSIEQCLPLGMRHHGDFRVKATGTCFLFWKSTDCKMQMYCCLVRHLGKEALDFLFQGLAAFQKLHTGRRDSLDICLLVFQSSPETQRCPRVTWEGISLAELLCT